MARLEHPRSQVYLHCWPGSLLQDFHRYCAFAKAQTAHVLQVLLACPSLSVTCHWPSVAGAALWILQQQLQGDSRGLYPSRVVAVLKSAALLACTRLETPCWCACSLVHGRWSSCSRQLPLPSLPNDGRGYSVQWQGWCKVVCALLHTETSLSALCVCCHVAIHCTSRHCLQKVLQPTTNAMPGLLAISRKYNSGVMSCSSRMKLVQPSSHI